MDPNVEITLLTYGSKTIDCFLGHVQQNEEEKWLQKTDPITFTIKVSQIQE